MTAHISVRNSKLGLIPSINLPPVVTCRASAPCFKGCYAMKGHFCFQQVKDTMTGNYALYKGDPDVYFEDIKDFLTCGVVSYRYFRFHAAGDIPDDNYFERMVRLADDVGSVEFLAFTKRFNIINNYIERYGELPENLHIVFSAWDKDFEVDNPHDFPVAYVDFKDESRNPDIPKTAMPCSGDCTKCLGCWGIKRGECVTFHQH